MHIISVLHQIALRELTLEDAWNEKLGGVAPTGAGIDDRADLFRIELHFRGHRKDLGKGGGVDVKKQLVDQLGELTDSVPSIARDSMPETGASRKPTPRAAKASWMRSVAV